MFRFILANSLTNYMKGQLQLEQIEKNTLKDKLHNMAETLRNCTDLKQGQYGFYRKHVNGTITFCAIGALGYRAGIPIDTLEKQPYDLVFDKYGLTKEERQTLIKVTPKHEFSERQMGLENAIWYMNDYSNKSFNELADWLDNLVD